MDICITQRRITVSMRENVVGLPGSNFGYIMFSGLYPITTSRYCYATIVDGKAY